MADKVPIQSCGHNVCDTCDTSSPCLVKSVKSLPDPKDADCSKVYSDKNEDLWVVESGKWKQVNKDKNSHVPAKVTGVNGIIATQNGVDNQTIKIDGQELLNLIKDSSPSGRIMTSTIIYTGTDVKNSFPFPDYDDYDEVKIFYQMGSTHQSMEATIANFKSGSCHIYAQNMGDVEDVKQEIEAFTKLVDGNKLTIEKNHVMETKKDGVTFSWGNNLPSEKVTLVIKQIIAYKYQDEGGK